MDTNTLACIIGVLIFMLGSSILVVGACMLSSLDSQKEERLQEWGRQNPPTDFPHNSDVSYYEANHAD